MDININQSNNKHAYLIICHKNLNQLKQLLKLLDDKDNDIYIHIDKKSKGISFDLLENEVNYSKLFFTKRIKVNWGGYSLVRAELLLLRLAIQREHAYYHLLSEACLPLCSQKEIHSFFLNHNGNEYISIDDRITESSSFAKRIKFFYLFQERLGRNIKLETGIWFKLYRKSLRFQKAFEINRIEKAKFEYYKGAQWFSITDNMAKYVVDNFRIIKKQMQFTFCTDEIFLQTLAMMSPYRNKVQNNNLRLIDWQKGSPYVFRLEDYNRLMNSGFLFARKFDNNTDNEIILRISETIKKIRS